jgi:hydrogenase expression/formation protein HypE
MKTSKTISLSHGSGGRLTHDLVRDLMLKEFENQTLAPLADSAILEIEGVRIAFTTDSYTVDPIFFPGGNIGKLAVCGTINDLSVMGARPLYLSCSYIVEEGLDYAVLTEITTELARAAKSSGVQIVTGDTKVVQKGKGDKIFINTSGIGICEYEFKEIQTGDKVLINGTIGDHEIAILTAREQLGLESQVESDCAALSGLISDVLKNSSRVKFMRDATRGGIATVLNEVTENNDFGILLHEDSLPIKEEVQGMCALLGFDPLYLANEGKVLIIVDSEDAKKCVSVMRDHEFGHDTRAIGEVVKAPAGKVCLRTRAGGTRIVDMLTGEQLPRIC